jgi:hypothetical protein
MSKNQEAEERMSIEEDAVPTGTVSQPMRVLSQQELREWWPFARLDPKWMPRVKKNTTIEDVEDAPF